MMQAPAVSLETTVEQRLLTALEALQGQVRDLRTNLMGSGEPEHENEHGRLPRVEMTAKQNTRDIDWLKESKADAIDLRELKMEVTSLKESKADANDLREVKMEVASLKETRVSAQAYWKSAQWITGVVTGLIGALGGGMITVLAERLLSK